MKGNDLAYLLAIALIVAVIAILAAYPQFASRLFPQQGFASPTTSTLHGANFTSTICSLPMIPAGCTWVSTANATAPCAGHISCPANATTINQPNGTVAIGLKEELNNSANAGFILNQTMFYSNSSAGCERELISYCNNNVPAQFICINRKYSAVVEYQYGKIYNTARACPMFIEAGNISCGVVGNYCVVMWQR